MKRTYEENECSKKHYTEGNTETEPFIKIEPTDGEVLIICEPSDSSKFLPEVTINEENEGNKQSGKINPKKGRLSSGVWVHFTRSGKDKGICRHCTSVISIKGGSMGNLTRHMKYKHPCEFMNLDKSSSRSSSPGEDEKSDEKINYSSQQRISRNQDWNHFRKVGDGRVECQYCQGELSFSLSNGNLYKHLREKHPKEFLNFEDIFSSSRYKSGHLEESCNQSFETEDVIPLIQNHEIDHQLLKMICKGFHRFSLVDNEDFIKFIKLLHSDYKLPDRKTLSNNLLQNVYNDSFSKILNELTQASSVCLTCESWTSMINTTFYSLTAHYITSDTKYESSILECSEFYSNHTSNTISDWIESVTKKCNINSKISVVVADNIPNIISAVNNLNLKHIPCFAYCLNSIIQNSIQNNINPTIKKIRYIVNLFKSNDGVQSKFKEIQERLKMPILKLKRDNPLWWKSTFDMIDRIVFNKEAIISTLVECDMNKLIESLDWDIMENVIKLLSIVNEVFIELSSEKFISWSKTCIFLRVIIKRIKLFLEVNLISETIEKLGNELLNKLQNNFENRQNIQVISESIFLDPRFKKYGFFDDVYYKKIKKSLMYTIVENNRYSLELSSSSKYQQDSSVSSIWEDFDAATSECSRFDDPETKARLEIDRYLNEALLSRTSDPIDWWKLKKYDYPNLYKIMLDKLCIPATSIRCDVTFSKMGEVLYERRSQLSTKKLTQMLFINNNLREI